MYLPQKDSKLPTAKDLFQIQLNSTLRIRNEIYFSHSLRHPQEKIMLSKGIPLQTITERLRNTSLMILSLYTHSSKNLEVKLAKSSSDAFTF